MKNNLESLNNYLFSQLERLDDEELSEEELSKELARTRGITSVGATIIKNAEIVLKAVKFNDEKISAEKELPDFLIGDGSDAKISLDKRND